MSLDRSSRMLALCTAACLACGSRERGERSEEAVVERASADGTIRLTAEERAALSLEVGAAQEGELPDTVTRIGRVSARPAEEAWVALPVASRVVDAPLVAPGAQVAVGDPLLRVAPVLATAERVALQLQGADLAGQLRSSRAEMTLRESALARARDLGRDNIVTQARVQEAETAVASTRARLAALERARAVQSNAVGDAIMLRAPVSGVVVNVEVTAGAVLSAGATVLRLQAEGPRFVDLLSPPEDPRGAAFEVEIGGHWYSSDLVSAGRVVGADHLRHDRLSLPDRAWLEALPGTTVTVRVARERARGVLLPASSVVSSPEGEAVFVEAPDGVFTPRTVMVATRFGEQVRLLEGVRPGERVVLRGAMALRGERLRESLGEQD